MPADTTGAFTNDNGASLYVRFWLGAGSNRTSGTLNTSWASRVTANIAVGQTNLAAATNNYWQITGVQLEVGPVATGFEFKSYGQELRECQRYYYRVGGGTAYEVLGLGPASSTTNVDMNIALPITLRSAPSAVTYSTLELLIPSVATYAISNLVRGASEIGRNNAQIAITSTGLTQYRNYFLRTANSTNGYLAFSAEL